MAATDDANGPTIPERGGGMSSTTSQPSRPAGDSRPGASTTSSSPTGASVGSHGTARARSSGAALAIAMLVLGLVLGAAGIKLIDGSDDGGGDVLAGNVDANSYQAVILANDKVYFGKLTEVNDTFFRLDQAFFLRETRESEEAEPVRTLLPVNRELHAPENSMLIRQDEVVLVEDLDKESPVLEEIKRQTGSGSDDK